MQKKGRTKKWTPCGIFSKRTQNPSRILGLFFGFPRNPLFSKSHFHHTKYTVLMIQPFLIKKKLHDFDRALFNPGLVVLVYIYSFLSFWVPCFPLNPHPGRLTWNLRIYPWNFGKSSSKPPFHYVPC